jgi:hypothetical protein
MLRKHSLLKSFPARLLILAATFFLIISGSTAQAQTGDSTGEITQNGNPAFREYKGVTIGMTLSEVRHKLGDPKDSSGGQDLYRFSEAEVAQIFYDQSQQVKAVSINYMGEKSGAPDCKQVLGLDIKAAADGTIRQLVRYPKAGFWVSYNRFGTDDPVITVTIQKIR